MCTMMLAVLWLVGRADVCVDGCGIDTCIDVGSVDSRIRLTFAVMLAARLSVMMVYVVMKLCISDAFNESHQVREVRGAKE